MRGRGAWGGLPPPGRCDPFKAGSAAPRGPQALDPRLLEHAAAPALMLKETKSMSHRRSIVACALALCCGLAGSCGGDASSDPGPSAEEACAHQASAYCGRRMACWTDYAFQTDWASLADCVSERKSICMADLQHPGTGLTAARTD